MDAEILPDHQILGRSPYYEIFPEHPGPPQRTFDHIGREGYRMPVICEYDSVDHSESFRYLSCLGGSVLVSFGDSSHESTRSTYRSPLKLEVKPLRTNAMTSSRVSSKASVIAR